MTRIDPDSEASVEPAADHEPTFLNRRSSQRNRPQRDDTTAIEDSQTVSRPHRGHRQLRAPLRVTRKSTASSRRAGRALGAGAETAPGRQQGDPWALCHAMRLCFDRVPSDPPAPDALTGPCSATTS